jgi:hypothetical protein
MSDYEFAQMHDHWLADARSGTAQVWCENSECHNHTEPVTVSWESEYGQGSYVPEECWLCGHGWTETEPDEEEK